VYLGVTLTDDLTFNRHINNTCLKVRSQLGLLYRQFNLASPSALSHLYKTLVLPTLDYCSSLWDPLYEVHSNHLEGVQRLAAKIVTKKWDAHHDHLLNILKWERLSLRRKKQKVMLCHRILRGGSIIPSNSFSPHPSPHIRHNHSFPLYCPNARTRAHQSSFLNSVIPLWNSIKSDIMSTELTLAFKYRLKRSLSPFT